MSEFIAQNVRGGIAGRELLHGVSLRIRTGEIHILMGPNGSGKTTLAYLLMGHPAYAMTDGSVRLDGTELCGLPPDQRSRRGIFLGFQHPVELGGVDMAQLLREAKGCPITPSFLGRIDTVARRLGLPGDTSMRPVNQGFSGGEKKRAEILQMVLLRPKFAILDEPDSGLDVDGLKCIAAELRKMAARTGMLIITHHRRITQYVVPNYVHVLVDGRIVASGGPELIDCIEADGYAAFR